VGCVQLKVVLRFEDKKLREFFLWEGKKSLYKTCFLQMKGNVCELKNLFELSAEQ
jgi:hypothetical protein